MYHRVVDLDFDPQLLAVSPLHFAEQLEVLRTVFRPLSLSGLATRLGERRFPRRAVAVTIDDGYADSLERARPLLERFDVPATAFIATSSLDGDREFWWDELERLVFGPATMPETVQLSVDGERAIWALAARADDPAATDLGGRSWNVERADDPGPRHRLYRSLYERLHPLTTEAKWRLLGELRDIVGAEPLVRPTHRTLRPAELAQLADDGFIEVGAHSMTHPALGGLPSASQAAEITGSRAALEAILSRPVTSFAFPHGSYTQATVAAVRAAGFARACTSDAELVSGTVDPFLLPRIVPRDWDGDQFARWLRAWMG
jgi:peptidoglycan/xylan/chitin deacetylase (PgdA/CDA1 family)